MKEAEIRAFRDRFHLPISDEEVDTAPFYRPTEDSPEVKYVKERRALLGGPVPSRREEAPMLPAPSDDIFKLEEGVYQSVTRCATCHVSILCEHFVVSLIKGGKS